MRTILTAVAVALLASAVGATPIPGSPNEITNGDFGAGLTGWTYTPGEVKVSDYGNPTYSVQCDKITAGWGDLISQIVDESTNPLWRWDMHAKLIDLEADISIDWKGDAEGGVRLRIRYWDESYNGSSTAPVTPPTYELPWQTYLISQGYGPVFVTVNPYNQQLLPMQPRWLMVEIEFDQPTNVISRVDNVKLTAKCVPDPTGYITILAGLTGLAGVVARMRRR